MPSRIRFHFEILHSTVCPRCICRWHKARNGVSFDQMKGLEMGRACLYWFSRNSEELKLEMPSWEICLTFLKILPGSMNSKKLTKNHMSGSLQTGFLAQHVLLSN